MLGMISKGKGLLSLFKATIAQLIIIRRKKSLADINIYALCCPIYFLNFRSNEAEKQDMLFTKMGTDSLIIRSIVLN